LAAWLLLCCAVYAAVTAATTAYAATYVWAVALALQEGVAAGVGLWLWLAAASLVALRHVATFTGDGDTDGDSDGVTLKTPSATGDPAAAAAVEGATWWQVAGRRSVAAVAIVAVNVLPVFVVNLVYVYTTTLRWSAVTQAAAVTVLALFKLTWNVALFRLTIGSDATRRWLPSPADRRWLVRGLVLVSLCNVIVSPLATEMLVSPNCLQYVFTAIPVDTYAVSGGTCYWIEYTATDLATDTTQQVSAIPCTTYAALQATYNSGSELTGGNYELAILVTTSDGEASSIDFQAGFTYNFACAFSLQWTWRGDSCVPVVDSDAELFVLGTLPGDALCANGNLAELILSGLHSAASCRTTRFRRWISWACARRMWRRVPSGTPCRAVCSTVCRS
jgi:hypothetical protein